MTKLKLEKVIKLDSVLSQVEGITGFSVETHLKLAGLKAETEQLVEGFFKKKDKVWKALRIADELPVEEMSNRVKYMIVQMSNAATVVLPMAKYIEATEGFEAELEEEIEVKFNELFELSEFEVEVKSDGKDKEKKKNSLVNSGILKELQPFIK
jgi:hypothetical protein